MNILAFVDIHGSVKALEKVEEKAKDADILVCAGDMSMFEQGLDILLGRLNNTGKTVLMIHGNHETPEVLKRVCERFDKIVFIHKKTYIKDDTMFIGYGGGGFSLADERFERFAEGVTKDIKKDKKGKKNLKIVLVTHAPPYGTKLDFLDEYSGNKSIRSFVEKVKPKLVICGHFHEHRGEFDYIGETEVINPGPYGRMVKI